MSLELTPIGEALVEMGIPEDRHAYVVALNDQLMAARAAAADRSEIDRLTIALGAMVEDCFDF
jgi:hypothetical protein